MDTLQETARVVTSKPVQRAVVNTVLLGSAAVALLFSAAIASALFFQNFLPHEVVTMPVHLQYGSGLHPYGLVSLTTPPMKSQQDYDISLTLSLPRSAPNVERGNFMVQLHLLDSPVDGLLEASAEDHAVNRNGFGGAKTLYSSRRPALLKYVDPFVSLASRIFFIFYHVFVPGSSTDTLIIPLAERVWFPKGSKLPGSAYIAVEAGQTIQTYQAALRLTAQLRGLRWMMVHYRILTYLAFTFLFWGCEVVFMGLGWLVWASMTEGASEKAQGLEGAWQQAIKRDDEAEGDDSREWTDHADTFPTYGRQPPLKYEPELKMEVDEDPPLAELPRAGAEADDEDEDDDDEGYEGTARDSGLGTSYSEEGKSSVRRRSSRSNLP